MKKLFVVLLAVVLLMGLSISPAQASVTEYVCNPGPDIWNRAGLWGDGTVLEVRICTRFDSVAHKVSAFSYWRTRNGGTPILSDWDLDANDGDLGMETKTGVYVPFDNTTYGYRHDFGDAIGKSFITISSYWGCAPYFTDHTHQAQIANVRANPVGAKDISGYKSATGFWANDSWIDC